jgi:hypothetical protein
MEDFWQRFRNQFNDNEWAKLIREAEFKQALLSLDEKGIQHIADKILVGNAKTVKEAREMRDYYERFGKHHDYLNPKSSN